jgi:hypothetical protein
MPPRHHVFLAAGLTIVSLTFSAAGQTPKEGGMSKVEDIDPRGRPEGFGSSQSPQVAIWHAGGRWHVATSSPKKQYRYIGEIRANRGTIEDLVTSKTTNRNATDIHRLNKEKTRLDFDLKSTYGDNFSFRVSPEVETLQFQINVNGQAIPERIIIGKERKHPQAGKFSLMAQPGKKK